MQVDRQNLLFFIILFIFLTSFSGNEQQQQTKVKDTLLEFHEQLIASDIELANSTYKSGYGNLTGFHLSYQDNLDGLNASFWPFHEYNDSYPWVEAQNYSLLPNRVSQTARRIERRTGREQYPLNISGVVDGEFQFGNVKGIKRFELTPPKYLEEYYDYLVNERYLEEKERYSNDPQNNQPPEDSEPGYNKFGNVSFTEGQISMAVKSLDYLYKNHDLDYNGVPDLEDGEIDDVVIVTLIIAIADHEEIERFEFECQGVYFQRQGKIVALTNSAKFFGNYALPHFLSVAEFGTAQTLMRKFLNTANIEKNVGMDELNQFVVDAYEKCELVSFFQFEDTGLTYEELRAIDEELWNPSGVPVPSLPKLAISDFVIYSPDCGKVLRKTHDVDLTGFRGDVLIMQFRNFLIILLLSIGVQLMLFLRQIKLIRTPGQLSTISAKSLYILGIQDSLVAFIVLLASAYVERLYLILACIAVLSFIMCGIFEIMFMDSVMSTQANERGTSWWEILRGGTAATPGSTNIPANNATPPNSTGTILPLANTPRAAPTTPAPTPITTTTTGGDPQWEDSSYATSLFASGITLTIIASFLILKSLDWRIVYRRAFEYVAVLTLNSYWIPQFFRNTLKNRRISFSWEFVFGISTLRLLQVFYFTLYKSNPFKHHYDPKLSLVLTSWLGLQIYLLHLQSKLGPRFWVNEKWLPKAYDYQVVLEIKDLENGGFASDLLANLKPEEEHDGIIECKTTCSICMADLDLPLLTDGENREARKKINNKEYMVTPCHHVFHSECLGSWMKYKLQCPVCRDNLPPI